MVCNYFMWNQQEQYSWSGKLQSCITSPGSSLLISTGIWEEKSMSGRSCLVLARVWGWDSCPQGQAGVAVSNSVSPNASNPSCHRGLAVWELTRGKEKMNIQGLNRRREERDLCHQNRFTDQCLPDEGQLSVGCWCGLSGIEGWTYKVSHEHETRSALSDSFESGPEISLYLQFFWKTLKNLKKVKTLRKRCIKDHVKEGTLSTLSR